MPRVGRDRLWCPLTWLPLWGDDNVAESVLCTVGQKPLHCRPAGGLGQALAQVSPHRSRHTQVAQLCDGHCHLNLAGDRGGGLLGTEVALFIQD